MREFIYITKALADPNRVRVLLALEGQELCVCQIVEFLGLAPSTVSKHLAILNQVGLIRSRKAERWVYYELAGKKAAPSVRGAIAWVRRSLAGTAEAATDEKRLKQLLKIGREILCQRQAKRPDWRMSS